MFDKYTAVNQADDELYKSSLDSPVKPEPRRLRSSYLWFAVGLFAALVTTLVLTLSYGALTKREKIPEGLIPDCMLLR